MGRDGKGEGEMIIQPIKDSDSTDAVILSFSNQMPCKLNNLQLDSLKNWLKANWSDSGLVMKK